MLMPVMAELQQGARTPAEWVGTGEQMAAMVRARHNRTELERRGFYLDAHVAHLCRARGIVLWTDDADHERLRPYVGHQVEPLPR